MTERSAKRPDHASAGDGPAAAATGLGDGPGDVAYLAALGHRVRSTRAARGMTRRMLARDSDVSERYLAKLEGGEGNLSISLLRRVAAAMDLPLADLVDERAPPNAELRALQDLLARLPAPDLAEARRLLQERFGPRASGDRGRRIALIGLRGAGKTTLGRLLAHALEVPFLEMRPAIEQSAGLTVDEIFNLGGQSMYRRLEREALADLVARHPAAVIATGGSLVTEPATFDLLRARCVTVWVQAAPEEHMQRVLAQGDVRPMAGNRAAMQDLRQILAARGALYALADAVLDTSGQTIAESLAGLEAIARRAGLAAAGEGEVDRGRTRDLTADGVAAG
ncbi:helix-turn-helix transcriptional regulator [Marinibaculum pumilum]|uniref:Shikimate kinase n=1 Tax=Marinibaculum pumilum TaxID=1766165 RepID=A0ABV7KXS9_9PROT